MSVTGDSELTNDWVCLTVTLSVCHALTSLSRVCVTVSLTESFNHHSWMSDWLNQSHWVRLGHAVSQWLSVTLTVTVSHSVTRLITKKITHCHSLSHWVWHSLTHWLSHSHCQCECHSLGNWNRLYVELTLDFYREGGPCDRSCTFSQYLGSCFGDLNSVKSVNANWVGEN